MARYPGIMAGDIGEVVGPFEGGFAVRFKKVWPQVISNTVPVESERVLWFPIKEIQLDP